MNKEIEGCFYMGMFCPEYGGLYWDNSPSFYHGGLDGVSRCIKTSDSYAVVVKETKYLDMKTKGKLEILEELPDGWLLCRQDGHVFKRRYRIRKLTPRTCFRLQGLKDSDVDLIQAAGISESQQYKLAGNSICVPVLEAIFTQLFTAESDTLF